jgi:protein-tyrosine-phosphatase
MKKVLFVCVENSCRSQMAEAFGKIHGQGVIESCSSGSRPSGVVNEKAIATMADIGYDLATHSSKSLEDIPQVEFDYAVTMGCGDECPYVQTKNREDWQIPDPKHMEPAEFRRVRDMIEAKVIDLIEEIKDV